MSGPVGTVAVVSRRLGSLFLLALMGIFVMVGAVVFRVAGGAATGLYAGAVLFLLVLGARAAKRRLRDAARAAGRTCTCCTTSVHDPVQVI